MYFAVDESAPCRDIKHVQECLHKLSENPSLQQVIFQLFSYNRYLVSKVILFYYLFPFLILSKIVV